MGIIDWVILALIVISAVWGLMRGFGHSSLKRWAFLLGLVAAYYIGVPIARGLMDTGFGNDWLTGLYAGLLPEEGAFAESLAGLSAASQEALMSTALTELGCPTFIQGFVTTRAVIVDGTVQTALASSFAYWTLLAASFIIFFLVCYFILNFLFKLIAEPLLGENGKGIVGRILGLVKSVAKTTLLIIIVMIVFVFVDQIMLNMGDSTLHDWIDSDLALNTSSFSLGRLFHDTAASLLSWISLL